MPSGDITLYGVVVLGKDVSGKVTVRLGSGEIVEGTSTGLLTSAMLGLIAGPARDGHGHVARRAVWDAV